MKVSTRLLLVLGSLCALLLILGANSLLSLSDAKTSLANVYRNNVVGGAELSVVQNRLVRMRMAIAAVLVTPTEELIKRNGGQLDEFRSELRKSWAGFQATELGPRERELAKRFNAEWEALDREGFTASMAALQAGQVEAAKEIAVTKTRTLFYAADTTLRELNEIQVRDAAAHFEEAESAYRFDRMLSLGLMIAGAAAALALGLAVIRSINRSIDAAIVVTQRIAQGDLTQDVHITSEDELGQLLKSLRHMQAALVSLVGSVRQSSDSIATGSAQIAAGSGDLSQRTERQASNLEQTASAMEQLSSSVQHGADTAATAARMAAVAAEAAKKGGLVMGDMVSTMTEISSSSRRIGDIIGVIDGIAFQTNILALNAAVEAARAGEHGRGFAVVASEVRGLAQRSAEAAREIKQLITASSERVENGSELVARAGQSMDEIVTQIYKANDLIRELEAASREQSTGIGQVSLAVTDLDAVTQQNAALVEESNAAAESLRGQAQQLVGMVASFKLP